MHIIHLIRTVSRKWAAINSEQPYQIVVEEHKADAKRQLSKLLRGDTSIPFTLCTTPEKLGQNVEEYSYLTDEYL